VIDLCCGVGGLSRGFLSAFPEGKIMLAADNFLPACQVMVNWLSKLQDEVVVEHRDLYRPGVLDKCQGINPSFIIGGTPCPDFSRNGRQKEGSRAEVTLGFASMVIECQPFVVIIENVVEILSSDTYKQAHMMLVTAGYSVLPIKVSGSAAGLPTSRQRVFICGISSKLANGSQILQEVAHRIRSLERAKVTSISDVIGGGRNQQWWFATMWSKRFKERQRGIRLGSQCAPTIMARHAGSAPEWVRDDRAIRVPSLHELTLLSGFEEGSQFFNSVRSSPSRTTCAKMLSNAVPPPMAHVV
ncbi:unnamed protein product, partial [Chrysoparadoxa australica]